ncbi:hypothetical protein [Clostridium butyricum]|uniref:hypothetical protein n=1 Tax=Clostridium butyricum TaxID=1492 RepID=UPI0018A977D1|nr:hypothetical protein [Clostridium butyricum]MDB2156916.1 hypothetical protein [Clostridium butyricum]
MNKIKKIISMILLSTAMITVLPIGANAAWKQNNSGWWYTEGNSWATGWRNIDGIWYYFSPKSGYMYSSTTADGYFLNENGAWVDDSSFNISASKAEELVRQKYFSGTEYSNPYVRCYDFDGSTWSVRAYYDNSYKTTNTGWYYVDKNTGAVKSMF